MKKIPTFSSAAKEAAFWDKHDVTELLDDLTEDRETVFVRPEIGVVELRRETWMVLARLARRQKTTPAQLVRRWLNEKIREARVKAPKRKSRSA